MFAAANAHDDATALLLSAGGGAVLSVEDNLGMTILDHARVARDNPEMNTIDNDPAVIAIRSERIVSLIEDAIERHNQANESKREHLADHAALSAADGATAASATAVGKRFMRRLSLSLGGAAATIVAPARRMSLPSKQVAEPTTPPLSFDVDDSRSSPMSIMETPIRKDTKGSTSASKPPRTFGTVVV